MTTAAALLVTTHYVRINAGYTSMILQAHRDSVRIVMSVAQPTSGNAAFHLLGGKDAPLTIQNVDMNVWAMATSDKSSLIVTEAGTLLPVQVCDINNRPISDSIGHSFVISDIDHYLIHKGKVWVQSDTFTLGAGLVKNFLILNTSSNDVHIKSFTFTSREGVADVIAYRDPTYSASGTLQELRNKSWAYQDDPKPAEVYSEPGLALLTNGVQDEHFQIVGGKSGGSEEGGGDEWVIPAGRKMLLQYTNNASQIDKVSYSIKVMDVGTLQ